MIKINKEKHGNPWDNANPLSKLLFSWTIPFFVAGSKSDFPIHEIYKVPEKYLSNTLAEEATRNWDARSASKGNQKLLRTILAPHWKTLAASFTAMIIDECVLRIIPVLFLGRFVNSFNEVSAERKHKYFYGAIICFVPLLHNLLSSSAVWTVQRIGFASRISVSALIFRKMLRIPYSCKKEAKTGHLVNLLSNDVGKFDNNLYNCMAVFVAPIQFAILMCFLWIELGCVTSFVGATFVFILLPAQYFNGYFSKKFRKNIAKYTDERGRIMNEIVMAITVIKMYAWERPFSNIVERIRSLEIGALKQQAYLRGFVTFLHATSLKIVPYMTVVTIVLLGSEINSGKIFFALALYNIMCDSMFLLLPTAVAWLGELAAALNRIEDFLLIVEKEQCICYKDIPLSKEIHSPGIDMKNVAARWNDCSSALSQINIDVVGDKLVMIVGAVGSGKTSLLNTMISELELSNGKCNIRGRLSYCSQEAWIFNESIRQNILFGRKYDQKRYEDVISASALKDDFKELPFGDMSTVGERGILLSGGQKARINLARALYREADIYLLDDPLSAVDSRVSRHIFEKCIQKHLSGKLRILATHQLQYLPFADHVVVVNKGVILAQGRYKEIINNLPILISNENLKNVDTEDGTENADGNFMDKDKTKYRKFLEESEMMNEGSVTKETYWSYFRLGGNMFQLFLLCFLAILTQILQRSADYWLSFWTSAVDKQITIFAIHPIKRENEIQYETFHNSSSTTTVSQMHSNESFYLFCYTLLVSGFILCCALKIYLYFNYSLKISSNLYNNMFSSLIRAPLSFFDTNSSGRIMNRFTKDVGTFDETLPQTFYYSVDCLVQLIGMFCLIIFSNYYLVIPSFIIFILLWTMRTFYVKVSRKVKRIESVAKSPIFTHLSASIQGISTIRSFGHQEQIIKEFDDLQDKHSSAWFLVISTSRAFAFWIDLICIIFLSFVTLSYFTIATDSSSGNVGLVITSLLTLLSNLQWGTRQSADTENLMTSVERALEYVHLESESPLESQNDIKPPKDWPDEGRIQFRNVSLSYNKDKQDTLKNISFDVKPGEKIGVVGRTGAGKTSIISALFRLTEPRGEILVGGVLINNIGLHDLRRRISIIPQDPVLFSGTIRHNLDPFGYFKDYDLWNAIEEVQLKEIITSLELQVTDAGSNFSVGERQLLCLARSILRKNKIIVMDEATSNVDRKTDNLIQNAIRNKCSDCTIITIAHRLYTVMDSDRILVLDNGSILEFDHPHILLQNPNGALSSLVKTVGPKENRRFHQVAEKSYLMSHLTPD